MKKSLRFEAGVDIKTILAAWFVTRNRKTGQAVEPLEPSDDRFCALGVAGRQVLLLFKQGGTTRPVPMPGGIIPPHNGSGELHLAFAIAAAELEAWERRLSEKAIAIESRVTWPGGGRSLYFRDPDRHLVELLTPGCWPIY